MSINLKILIFIIVAIVLYYVLHRTFPSIFGGSFASVSAFGVENESKSFDDLVFQEQINKVNTFAPRGYVNKTIIVGDVHDSVTTAFAPLIIAGIVTSFGTKMINDGADLAITYTIPKTMPSNRVIYCGDIIGRGANLYAQQILDTLVKLSTEHHDNVVLILGNHDAEFLASSFETSYDKWDITAIESMEIQKRFDKYFRTYPSSIAEIFDSGGKSFIVSHTYLRSDSITFDHRLSKVLTTRELEEWRKRVVQVLEDNGVKGFSGVEIEKKIAKITTDKRDKEDVVVKVADDYGVKPPNGYRHFPQPKVDPRRRRMRAAPMSLDSARYYENSDVPFDFSDCVDESGNLDVEKVHAKLLTLLEKVECGDIHSKYSIGTNLKCLMNRLTYNVRPNTDGDEIVLGDELRKWKTTYNQIEWFVGHTQVQKYPKERRNVTSGDVTYHFMDVNTMNFCGCNLDEGESPGLASVVGKYKHGAELLYYAIVDGESGDVDYCEEVVTNDKIEKLFNGFDKNREKYKKMDEERQEARRPGRKKAFEKYKMIIDAKEAKEEKHEKERGENAKEEKEEKFIIRL